MDIELERIIREPERRRLTGKSKTTWWREEKAGKAPARVKLGPNSVGWRLGQILEYNRSLPTVQPPEDRERGQ